MSEAIIQTLHFPKSRKCLAGGDRAPSPRLHRLLARSQLSWDVINFLDYEVQMRLMDDMFLVSVLSISLPIPLSEMKSTSRNSPPERYSI